MVRAIELSNLCEKINSESWYKKSVWAFLLKNGGPRKISVGPFELWTGKKCRGLWKIGIWSFEFLICFENVEECEKLKSELSSF